MPRSRDLLEKLTGPQPIKKFPAFYGTRRFITVFTVACRLSPSRSRYSYFPSPLNNATHFPITGSTLEMGHIPQVKQAGKLLNFYGLIITVFVTIIFGNPAF